jgi:DnaJ-class molecular chaperone
MKKPHEILGVNANASPDEIKKAFKKLAMIHHPDKGGDPEKFKEINAAYQTLTNPQPENTNNFRGDFNFNDIFSGTAFEEVLRNNGFSFRRQYRNHQLRANVLINLVDVYYGCDKNITIRTATGKEKIVSCRIPAGIEHGQVIKYSGIGDDSIAEAPPGDLLVVVQIQQHPVYSRIPNSLHLVMDKTIGVFDAILGTRITVNTIDNKALSVNIARGTQQGTKIKLAGMGLRDENNNTGDLFVIIGLDVPNNLSEEQLKRLDEIRKMQ